MRPSEAIRGHQKPSEATIGHQESSEVIREPIRAHCHHNHAPWRVAIAIPSVSSLLSSLLAITISTCTHNLYLLAITLPNCNHNLYLLAITIPNCNHNLERTLERRHRHPVGVGLLEPLHEADELLNCNRPAHLERDDRLLGHQRLRIQTWELSTARAWERGHQEVIKRQSTRLTCDFSCARRRRAPGAARRRAGTRPAARGMRCAACTGAGAAARARRG